MTAFAAILAGQAALPAPAPQATLGEPAAMRAVLVAGAYPAPIRYAVAALVVGGWALVRRDC